MNELDINKIVPHCHLPNSVWWLYISNSMILWYISIHVFYFILLICTFLQENHFFKYLIKMVNLQVQVKSSLEMMNSQHLYHESTQSQPGKDITLIHKNTLCMFLQYINKSIKKKTQQCGFYSGFPFGRSKIFLTKSVGFILKGMFPSSTPLVSQCLMSETVPQWKTVPSSAFIFYVDFQ